MKQIIFSATAIIFFHAFVQAQSCDIKIEILPDQYMYGTASTGDVEVPKNKVLVDFGEELMLVQLTEDGVNYRIEVLNENCQAYCKRHKRVRQLHSGDEKLVINLINQRRPDIMGQLAGCGL